MENISFIIPSRNNLVYLKWCYNSIRKNLNPNHEICIADDASIDGTLKWLKKIAKKDKNLKYHVNSGPERQGLVVLYDKLINDYATNDIVMIFHADMYACPDLDKYIIKYIKPGNVVAATRIEPSLHPPGPEKIIKDFCSEEVEPEYFNEDNFLKWFNSSKDERKNKTTEGIFAPWAIYKKDFLAVGGHDVLFSPTSREDSDIFNRFQLNGYKFTQTWEGCVYHLTSRGSRFNKYSGGKPGQDSKEWQYTNSKNIRNFIRKWGAMVKHDHLMKPIISHKYQIGFKIKNCNYNLLQALEPWCDNIFVDMPSETIDEYIKNEQLNTILSLNERIYSILVEPENNIVIELNGALFNQQDFIYIQQLPEIIKDSGEIGSFELGNLKIIITNLKTYENSLINV
tara:strand:+ start:7572 stop:8765 length:1194 start_codon:yes stop_codon:yes gene_type:complete